MAVDHPHHADVAWANHVQGGRRADGRLLVAEQQGPAPAIPAAGAVPKPAPPEQLNLEAGKQQANQEMADAQVDDGLQDVVRALSPARGHPDWERGALRAAMGASGSAERQAVEAVAAQRLLGRFGPSAVAQGA